MAYDHLCGEFYVGNMQLIPPRIKRTNPDALEDRWVNYIYSMDISPEPGDDQLGNPLGAWSIWDLPVATTAQVDDDRGDDFITVSIDDRIYVLDWDRFYDEYNWDVKTDIYRLYKIGPLPSNAEDAGKDYTPHMMKRFREIAFKLTEAPTDSQSKYRVTVEEFNNESRMRQGVRTTLQKNRGQVSLVAADFAVTIEHVAHEQFSPVAWEVEWDAIRRPWRTNPVTTR